MKECAYLHELVNALAWPWFLNQQKSVPESFKQFSCCVSFRPNQGEQTRTTDAQRGNSLPCTAKNSIPIPNF